MTGRLVVAAVALLAVVAAGDALRRAGPASGEPGDERAAAARAAPVAPARPLYTLAGARLPDRVLRWDEEYLSAKAIAEAFPADVAGPVHVAQLAVARDRTLALGVYRFPSGRPLVPAIELWRDRRLVGAFSVAPGSFGGGLAFDDSGRYLATFAPDGELRSVFDRRGRRLAGVPASFFLPE